MPELPEVETVMSLVEKRILDKKIIKTKVLNPKLRWPIDIKKVRAIEGLFIRNVYRRGKYLIIEFNCKNLTLIIHLGMTGIISFSDAKSYKEQKHDHLMIYFKDFIMIFNDVRKFGSIHLCRNIDDMFLIKNLGIEPLSEKLDWKYIFDISTKRSCCIKELIMNQKVIVGIGNIYATESLFLSRIHPSMKANRLSINKAKQLVTSIKLVLSESIKMGGTTIRDFVDAEGKPGYFVQKLLIYQKEYCPIHKKHRVQNIKISGRSSFFCSKCQKE
mgnify:CR=1 FL=1